jgi:hypothetical protein
MAVGLPLKTTYADGDVFSASDINDTNGTINITAAPFAAGKNKIINGDFYINQRSFTSTTSTVFGFDRWISFSSDGTTTYSAETFTPGSCSTYDESSFEGWTFAPTIDDITPLLPAGFALEIWDGKPSCTNRDDENPLRTTGDTFAEAAAMMWLEVASLRGYGAN